MKHYYEKQYVNLQSLNLLDIEFFAWSDEMFREAANGLWKALTNDGLFTLPRYPNGVLSARTYSTDIMATLTSCKKLIP